MVRSLLLLMMGVLSLKGAEPLVAPKDPDQALERTCFQTGEPWSGVGNLRSDVAIVYGLGPDLPQRIKTWRDQGYRIHVMTGVAWGHYEDYLLGRFDGVNHEDEKQTDRHGNPHRHGNSTTVFYMCPGTNYGKFLCVGIQRALEAGAEAIHLEEPEYWVQNGYEEGFKREWQNFYGEPWQAPHASVDAQWRASKLKYFLYRRALQQVFDHVQQFNQKTGRKVRCYVPTHSLLNYAHWRIVSPQSSLARLKGCDGYIAQVWTGTARTPNLYQGRLRERTFETAFLEYGAMQNLVRSTGRTVWYLGDPVEDDPRHDWDDYRSNWQSTTVASLFQPDVWRYEVAPWPERVFGGRYPKKGAPETRQPMPAAYATEVQTVMNALNQMRQPNVGWDCGTTGIGVVVSDSLMYQRGDPHPGDPHLSTVYGLALPLLKRGMPVTPVQLENVTIANYLDPFRILLLTYHGMKPLKPEVHTALAAWVKRGGVLIVWDDDSDPYNQVREWWNSKPLNFRHPRQHLFEQLGLKSGGAATEIKPGALKIHGKGALCWWRENPATLAADTNGAARVTAAVKQAAQYLELNWRETAHLLLRRGPYLIAAGLDETALPQTNLLAGAFVNLFDAELRMLREIKNDAGSRWFLLDLEKASKRPGTILASAAKVWPQENSGASVSLIVDGVANTPAIILMRAKEKAPRSISLAGRPVEDFTFSAEQNLLWIRFQNQAEPRALRIDF